MLSKVVEIVLQCLKLHGFSNRASQFGKLVEPVASFSVTEVQVIPKAGETPVDCA